MATKIKRLDLSVGGTSYYLESDSTFKIVRHTGWSATIEPGVLNVWDTALEELEVSRAEGTEGHYMLKFTVSNKGFTNLIFMNNWAVTWAAGDAPEWEENTTYEISILDNVAVYTTYQL